MADGLEVRNPYTGAVIATVPLTGEAEADASCARAAAAFAETRELPAWRRAAILNGVADRLAAARDSLAATLSAEAGKPMRDALAEVDRAGFVFRVAAEEAQRRGGSVLPLDRLPGADGRIALVERVPLGPVLGITPFNFPLNLVAHKVAPAIASGNPIVIKPAPRTPLSALALGGLVHAAGWPEGALSVLPATDAIAARLLADPRLVQLSFTGSAAVGWRLRPAKRHVTLELGGNAAVLVHEDADLERAAARIVAGGFGYSGQSCISVQRVLVHRPVFERMVAAVTAGARRLRVGDPADPATEVGPMISVEAAVRAEEWVTEAVAGGAVRHTGGPREGAVLPPAVLTGVAEECRLETEEAFAPIVTLTPYDEWEEGLARANRSRYGLQAGIFTRDLGRIRLAHRTLEVGALLVNEVPTWRADHMPYGGVKESGLGREGVASAMESMTEPRLLILDL